MIKDCVVSADSKILGESTLLAQFPRLDNSDSIHRTSTSGLKDTQTTSQLASKRFQRIKFDL